jgi:alpha-D-xyloside xylohydrolase
MGDYAFNRRHWPDPSAMVRNLSALRDATAPDGTRIMVSAWPFVGVDSRATNAADVVAAKHVALLPNGSGVIWPDAVCDQDCYLYDATRPSARGFLFSMLNSGYVAHGISNFWFDASEPESLANAKLGWRTFDNPHGQPNGTTFALGTNQQVGMMFPYFHCQMVHDGLKAQRPDEVPVTLARSGWVGSWKFGAAQWNGDLVRATRIRYLSGPEWTTECPADENGIRSARVASPPHGTTSRRRSSPGSTRR